MNGTFICSYSHLTLKYGISKQPNNKDAKILKDKDQRQKRISELMDLYRTGKDEGIITLVLYNYCYLVYTAFLIVQNMINPMKKTDQPQTQMIY